MNVSLAVIASALSVFAAVTPGGPQAAPATESVRALAVRYADGRITTRPIGTSGRVSWTPAFPRISGADTSREGLELRALQFEEAIEGRDLVVTLALLYGTPLQKRLKVTTVRVTDAQPARVDALEAFGVKAVTLSIVTLPPAPALHIPSVTTPSSLLDATVEIAAGDPPGYRLVVVNRSSHAVMAFAWEAFRGEVKAVSGRPRGPGHTPLIAPGASHALMLGASASTGRGGAAVAWLPIDRFVITAVMWSDGLVEGDPRPAALEQALDAGTAVQLERIVARLRGAAVAPQALAPASLRAEMGELPVTPDPLDVADVHARLLPAQVISLADVRGRMASGMQNAKNAVLNDLDELLRAAGASAASGYSTWLVNAVAKFDAWRTRIAASAR